MQIVWWNTNEKSHRKWYTENIFQFPLHVRAASFPFAFIRVHLFTNCFSLQFICRDISKIKILVPGAGLGRLTYELAYRGYYCEGNEFSLFMLVASNFVLNKCIVENQYTLYPWVHQFVNNASRKDQVMPIAFPDVSPTKAKPKGGFNMVAGDFLQVSVWIKSLPETASCKSFIPISQFRYTRRRITGIVWRLAFLSTVRTILPNSWKPFTSKYVTLFEVIFYLTFHLSNKMVQFISRTSEINHRLYLWEKFEISSWHH